MYAGVAESVNFRHLVTETLLDMKSNGNKTNISSGQ